MVLWALVHAFAFVALVMMGGAGSATGTAVDPLRPNPLWIIVVTVALLLADIGRRGERALWGNLGVSMTQLAGLSTAVCLVSETLLVIARR